MQSLLVPTDFSQSCEHALARALQLPLDSGAQIVLLHVLADEATRPHAEAELVRASRPARTVPGLTIGYEVQAGDVSAMIAARARAHGAELVVMGRSHRHTLRQAISGTTVGRALRAGDVPVLLVHREPHGPYRRPLVAIDVDPDAVPAPATRVLEPDVHQIFKADPKSGILDEIAMHRADLVVLGAQTRTWLGRASQEQLVDQILDTDTCDVLLLPPELAASDTVTSGAAASADSRP